MEPFSQALIVYVTTETEAEAREIGAALLGQRLAACVNVLPHILSLFRWDGAVQSATEAAFVAKTTQARLPALIEEVKRLHSYDVPCVVAMPIVGGNPDFLAWLADETSE